MIDAVQQSFVNSFISYLKKQVDTQALAPDALESIEVAIQCLQAAFDLSDENGEEQESVLSQTAMDAQSSDVQTASSSSGNSGVPPVLDTKNIELFELFQSLYIERNPETIQMAEAIKNEGNRLMKEGKFNEALLQYNRAVAFDPKNPIFYCNRAAAHIRLGDNDRAIIDCKSSLLYNQNYGKAYGRLGIAYSNLGKYDEAHQAYAKAIELEPDNQDYRNNLEIALNARAQAAQQVSPNLNNLTEGLNAMLGNPAIRNLFNSAEIDLEQLQSMTQNPVVMNTIGQLFTGLQGGGVNVFGGGGTGGGAGPLPNDVLQLFQTFAAQLSNAGQDESNNSADGNQRDGGNRSNTGNGGQQPPTNN